MRTPRAVRPIQYEYMIIGEILKQLDYDLYETTIDDFLSLCMLKSKGHMNPIRIRQIYNALMNEAGLEPLYREDKVYE